MYQDSDHKPCLPRQYGDPVESQLAGQSPRPEGRGFPRNWMKNY